MDKLKVWRKFKIRLLLPYIKFKNRQAMRRQRKMLKRAKERADYLHSTTGKGYYVIWTGKKYMVATSKHIEDGLKSMCKHGVKVQTAKTKLINAAVYRAM